MKVTTIVIKLCRNEFTEQAQLREVLRSKASQVALWIPRNLPAPFSTPEQLQQIKETIQLYESHGISVIVWLGETCGHNGGEAEKAPLYTPIRTLDQQDTRPFCVTDKRFIGDFAAWLRSLVEIGAKTILIDDDWRMNFRADGFGCCCPNHMAAFAKELGEEIAEQDIPRKVFNGGKNRYRDAWIKVQGDAMLNFARHMRSALDDVDPTVRLGFCCNPTTWSVDCTNVPKVAQAMAGNTRPLIRTTGGPYWAAIWHHPLYYTEKTLGETVEMTRMEADWCRGLDAEILSEGDTYPKPRFTTPAAYLECFDMALYAADENLGILKTVFTIDADYETGYVAAMVRNKPHYEWIRQHFSGKRCVGIRPYNKWDTFAEAELDCNDPKSMLNLHNAVYAPTAKFASVTSLPTTYSGNGVQLVFGENGRHIDKEALQNGAILDIKAARLLAERGIDVGVETFGGEAKNDAKDFFDLTFHHFYEEDFLIRLHAGGIHHLVTPKASATVLTGFVRGEKEDCGIFTYENANGQRFMVFPFDTKLVMNVYGWLDCYSLSRLVGRHLEWLGRKPVPVLLDVNAPESYLLVKEDETTVTVGFWNMHPDRIDDLRFAVTGAYTGVEFYACDGVWEDGYVSLTSTVYPYEFAAFELKKV